RWEPDDSFDIAASNDLTAYNSFSAAAEKHAVRHVYGCFAAALQRSEDVQQKGEVAILSGRNTQFEPMVFVLFRMEPCSPRFERKRRICNYEVMSIKLSCLFGIWLR